MRVINPSIPSISGIALIASLIPEHALWALSIDSPEVAGNTIDTLTQTSTRNHSCLPYIPLEPISPELIPETALAINCSSLTFRTQPRPKSPEGIADTTADIATHEVSSSFHLDHDRPLHPLAQPLPTPPEIITETKIAAALKPASKRDRLFSIQPESVLEAGPVGVAPAPVKIPIRQVEVIGSTVFDAADFEPILRPLADRSVTLDDLTRAAD
ncbi:MAG: hypothetical protein F6K19_10505, partial [Cyanothece sp. SIO1E1]|nr:hypothetical protein [Cyanothece sp. SIO1E1]